jgi:hypothetical protein
VTPKCQTRAQAEQSTGTTQLRSDLDLIGDGGEGKDLQW